MRVLLVAAILFAPTSVVAQTEVHFKLLPPGELVMVQGKKMRGYHLHEWLELAAADSQLVKLKADVVDLGAMVEKLEAAVVAKDKEISTLENDKGILAKRGLRCDTDLKKCEADLVEAAAGPWWPYFVAAGGAVLGIVGTTAWLTDR